MLEWDLEGIFGIQGFGRGSKSGNLGFFRQGNWAGQRSQGLEGQQAGMDPSGSLGIPGIPG